MNEIKFKQKIETLKFNDKGLIPCVVQDHFSKEILMLAWGSKDTLVQTFLSGLATYWSRSRKEIWVKGKTSGNIQEIKKIYIDCDKDTVLFEVKQTGAACHTGSKSCFFVNPEGLVPFSIKITNTSLERFPWAQLFSYLLFSIYLLYCPWEAF